MADHQYDALGYDRNQNQNDENTPLLQSNSYSAVGVPSSVLEPPNVYNSRWRSIRIMYLTMFLSSVGFSICMSSIFPYLTVVDKSSDASFLGWVVAAYSLGQLVASPLFGAWANCSGNTRLPLLVSITIGILSNILYAYIQSIPIAPQYFLLGARALIGFGAGNVAVVRSYVSGATTIKERTGAMATMSACQAFGFIVGPGIQAALAPIGYPGPVETVEFHFNLYTGPGFLSALVGVLNIILLIIIFREHRIYDDESTNFSVQGKGVPQIPDYKPDYVAVVATIMIFFVVLFVFCIFETIATPLAMDMFGWTNKQATLYIGIILASLGCLSILVFIGIKFLSKRFNERYLLLAGFIICMLGFLVYLPWGNHYPPIRVAPVDSLTTATMPASSNYSTTPPVNATVEPVGCPFQYHWCIYTPAIFFYQFLGGTVLIAVGYPICSVMSYSLFSKILGPKPQGTMMGWLTASGSLSRTVGPIFVSQVYAYYGPRVTFAAVAGILLLTIFGVMAVFRHLVPFVFKKSQLVHIS